MNKTLVFLFLAAFLVLLPACDSSSSEEGRSTSTLWDVTGGYGGNQADEGRQGPAGAGAAAMPPTFGSGTGPAPGMAEPLLPLSDLSVGRGSGIPGTPARSSQSLASVSLEVESVQGATAQVQAIAQGLGGFVERLSTAGGSQSPRADIIIKVPQAQFTSALERIEAMGDVQFRSLGSEDVTDQHVDLAARLTTYRKEEQSLRSLMERSNSVSELLSVEREMARVQTNIERAEAQLDLLERQVATATIQVTLFPSGVMQVGFAAGSFTIKTSGVPERVVELREYIAGRRGVVDQFRLSTNSDEERAEVVFRVFADDFNRTAQFVESQGRVAARQLLERRDPSGQEGSQMRRPNARVQVVYLDSSTGVSFWIPILIIAGVLVLGGVVAYLMRQAYTRGRRRGSFI